jgi:hypothetical protein
VIDVFLCDDSDFTFVMIFWLIRGVAVTEMSKDDPYDGIKLIKIKLIQR